MNGIMILQAVLFSSLFVSAPVDTTLMEKFLRTSFQVVYTNDSLRLGVGTRLPMANPGSPFNATDVVDDTNVPSQRLGFIGKSDSLWFVYYEQGGYAPSWNLIFFKALNGKYITLEVFLLDVRPVKNVRELKAELNNCRIVSFNEPWPWNGTKPHAVKVSLKGYELLSNQRK
jgi:hypothetical protein